MNVKKIMHTILLAIFFFVPSMGHGSDDNSKGLFVLVTSGDPQTQMMAMVLSTQVVKKGKQVRILLCGPAGNLAVRNGEEVILKPRNRSPRMLLKNLIKKDVSVQVCPLYLPNKGLALSDLLEGVTQAKPPLVAEALLEPGVKLLNF